MTPDTCAQTAEVARRVKTVAEQKTPKQLAHAFIPFWEEFMNVCSLSMKAAIKAGCKQRCGFQPYQPQGEILYSNLCI
jgi:hypothetical protein